CAEVMLKAGHKKAVLMFWNYSFGQESMAAFKEGYAKGGGTIVKEIAVPFPNTEFQAHLSEIASLKPDAVFVFFAGAGAAKFVKVQGDTSAQKELIAALESVRFDSPRGPFRFSRAHNPVQDIYLRQAKGGQEAVLGVALKDADDPAAGCAMAK